MFIMGLRFIYGRAGTGKSTFCMNEIKKNINSNKKIYIITPEQYSYSAEKNLLKTLESNASVNAEVISFNRIANRIFTEVGGANSNIITKSGKAMLIHSILEQEKNNLNFLANSQDNIELILKEITEMKKHSITTKKIDEKIEKIEDIKLKEKLNDINKIYKLYEENIQNKYIDEEDVLTKLYEKIPESKMFNNSIVYIDEFAGFTTQEYKILTEILKKAEQINVTVCTDNLENNTTQETDIFYFNKNFIKILTDCAQNVDKKIEKPIFLEKKYRYKNAELNHLEENIYNNKFKKYNKKNKNIKLFLASTPYTEIEYIAGEITKLVREENIQYKDIAIITKNLDEINNIIKAVFGKYDIPIFIDEKSEITENILIKYVLSILEIFANNWKSESVFNYIKSGFINIEENEIYELEKYCKKYGIDRNKWYKKDWNEFNNLRKKIVEPLMEFKNSFNKEKTAKEISEKIYKYLLKNNIPEKLNKKIKKLEKIGEIEKAEEYKSSINILVDLLDEIVIFFKDEKMSFDKYKEILKVGLANKELGKIPQVIDQVIVGDINRTRSHKVKVVFIMEVNDGVFPSVNKNEGFINDKDRETLKKLDLELAKGTLENLYEDQFNIYKALTTAEEKLYVSYLSANKDGATLRPSILISKIKKIFPQIQEDSNIIEEKFEIGNVNATFEELLKNIRKLKNNQKIDDIWIDIFNWYNKNEHWKNKLKNSLKGLEYTNIAEKINEENIKKLYGKTLKTSISKLEQYKKCPFSFHLKYGLKIKEEEEYKIKALDTGSFMHEVLDTFFDRVENIKEIEDKEIEKIINEIINEKLKLEKNYIFSSSAKFIVLTNRLKKTIQESIKYIIYQIKMSDFRPSGHEVEFNKTIDNIEIIGKVDRIDIAENEEGNYIRIIDYKSSEKNIDLNQVIAGTQIQLLTYVDAISEEENREPAGILYYNLIEPIISENKNLSDEEIEEKIRKSFKMKGLILADIKVIKMMDKNIEKGSSNIIPVYLNKDGGISESRSNTISKEEFQKLQKTTRKIIKQIANEILSGKIDIRPMYNRKNKTATCKYCEYKTICGFNPSVNEYEYLQNKSKEIILEEIKNN